MIQSFGRAKLSRMILCSDDLTEALGEDHDLFMVLRSLSKEHWSNPARDFGSLAKRLSLKRAKLQKRAFKLGGKLYGEKPGGFAQRLERHLSRAKKHS